LFQADALVIRDSLKMRLGDDSAWVNLEHEESDFLQHFWYGRVLGDGGAMVISERGGTYSGRFEWKSHDYVFTQCANGKMTLARIDASALPLSESGWDANGNQQPPLAANVCPDLLAAESFEIDILMLYTADARKGAGLDHDVDMTDENRLTLAMEGEMVEALGLLNVALKTAKLPLRFRMAYAGLAEGLEPNASQNLQDVLGNLKRQAGIPELRNRYQADLVCLFVEGGPECGYANYFGGSDENAFLVVRRNCASNNYSFAHEVGHCLGLDHDCERSNQFGPGHGQVFVENLVRKRQTIMAIKPGVQRKVLFSDYLENWGSRPSDNLGPSCYANSKELINQNGKAVASFRCRPLVEEVWIKDNFADDGQRPNITAQNPAAYLLSPYVWLRRDQDKELTHLYQHQSPGLGENFLYAVLQNGMSQYQRGHLNVYCGEAAMDLTQMEKLLTTEDIYLPAKGTKVVEIPLAASQLPRHPGFVVVWELEGRNDMLLGRTILEMATLNSNVAAKQVAFIALEYNELGSMKSNELGRMKSSVASFRDTITLKVDPVAGSFIGISDESASGARLFQAMGGKVAACILAPEHPEFILDTNTMEPQHRPGHWAELGQFFENKIPAWVESIPAGIPLEIRLAIDGSAIQARGTYELSLLQITGKKSLLGGFTFLVELGQGEGAYIP
jgi:hypothetical protein